MVGHLVPMEVYKWNNFFWPYKEGPEMKFVVGIQNSKTKKFVSLTPYNQEPKSQMQKAKLVLL